MESEGRFSDTNVFLLIASTVHSDERTARTHVYQTPSGKSRESRIFGTKICIESTQFICVSQEYALC
jgi:hypothetical protein